MILDRFSFLNKYAATLGLFKDNNNREITEQTMREFSQDGGDSFMFLVEHAHNSFYAVASGTNNYTATPNPVISAYTDKQKFFIKFVNANTGPSTLNLAGLGAVAIKKTGNVDVAAGDIAAGQILLLVYDGTNFQIVGGGGGGGASVVDATETEKGIVQLATQTQATDAGNATSSAGANHTAAATPRGLWWFFEARRLLSLFYRWIFEYVDIAGNTYQPVLSDGGKIIRYSSSSAVTVTIPNDSTVNFPIGTRIRHRRTGTGIVTLSPASGVTFITPDATNLSIRKVYGYIDTIKTAANTWQLDHSPSSSWEFFKTQPATITAAWEIVGTDDSNATYCFVLKNLSGNIIARFRNDQVFEVGGTSHFIKVPAGIPSGNSKFEFLNNQLLAYIFGTSSNNFLEFQSTTGDLRVRFKVRRELEQSGAQLFEFNVETSVTATSGGVTTIGSFPMAAGYVANVELNWVASANDGNCAGGVLNHTIKRVGTTTSAVGMQTAVVRSNLVSAPSMSIVANDTTDAIDFNFTNGLTPDHRAYKVNIFACILYTPIAT